MAQAGCEEVEHGYTFKDKEILQTWNNIIQLLPDYSVEQKKEDVNSQWQQEQSYLNCPCFPFPSTITGGLWMR